MFKSGFPSGQLNWLHNVVLERSGFLEHSKEPSRISPSQTLTHKTFMLGAISRIAGQVSSCTGRIKVCVRADPSTELNVQGERPSPAEGEAELAVPERSSPGTVALFHITSLNLQTCCQICSVPDRSPYSQRSSGLKVAAKRLI